MRSAARAEGLSSTQAHLLLRVTGHPEERRRVGVLAGELDVSQPTVSDAIATLERKGLVERERGADARAWALRATRRGRTAAMRLRRWDLQSRLALADQPREEREQALVFLTSLIASLHDVGLISVARTCPTCKHFRPDRNPGGVPHCALLDMSLPPERLRVDCPEHELRAA